MQVKSIAECSKGEQSTILLTFIKQPFVINIFVLSIFEWPFYKGFTLYGADYKNRQQFQDKNIGMIMVNVILYNLKYSHTQYFSKRI